MLYCPKCNQKYKDGSQRFCDIDGSRLLPETSVKRQTGVKDKAVFTNILGKTRQRNEKDSESKQLSDSAKTEQNKLRFELPQESKTFKNEPESIEKTKESSTERKSIFNVEPPQFSKPVSRIINPSEVKIDQAELGDRRTKPSGRVALSRNNPEILLGKTVKGRYEITAILEQDDSSIAYLAKDKIIRSKQAIVRVLMEENSRESLEDKIFAEERVSLSHINHPNISKFIDSGELPEGKPFIVTEFIEGESVGDVLEKGKEFNPMRVARIIGQASYALGEVHQNGIIHRSLKPKHILLTVNDSGKEQVKVKDFCVSSGRDSKTDFIYKSPEQVGGQLPTFTSDTYSLAVIAYEMLTGQKPFDAESSRELLKLQKKGIIDKPSELKPDLPALVDGIIEKALSYNPSERYPKARDFGDALYNSLTTVSPWDGGNEEKTEIPEIETETDSKNTIIPPLEIRSDSETSEDISPDAEDISLDAADAKSDIHIPSTISETDSEDAVSPDFERTETEESETAKKPTGETLWEKRSPEPVKESSNLFMLLSVLGLLLLAVGAVLAWQYFGTRSDQIAEPRTQTANLSQKDPTIQNADESNLNVNQADGIEFPPPEREIPEPPNSKFFENSKQNLDNELAKHFRGFSLYYPEKWVLNESKSNFLDIVKKDETGYPKEQFLVTYYDSNGTFELDKDKFPELVEKSNKILEQIFQNQYQVVSQGNITVNNGWKSYEVKFKGNAYTADGKKIEMWGRRIWMPAARPGIKTGFVITMFATSFSDKIDSVDDVGKKGDMGDILYTFEPDRNY